MMNPSFRDVEQLSASLDGQLSQAEKTRLETRLRSDPALAAALADLRLTRTLLRRTPRRRLPRNFTLTPKMAGIRPPLPRGVPALSWASAVAMLMFVLTLGTNLLGQLSFGAAAPMMASAPMSSEGYGIGGGPPATEAPITDNALTTPTPEAYALTAPQATQSDQTRAFAPPATPEPKAPSGPVNLWLYVWPGLAVALIAAALLIRKASLLAFRRKLGQNHHP